MLPAGAGAGAALPLFGGKFSGFARPKPAAAAAPLESEKDKQLLAFLAAEDVFSKRKGVVAEEEEEGRGGAAGEVEGEGPDGEAPLPSEED